MNLVFKVLLAKVHTVLQWAPDYRPGLGGLNQVMGPTVPFLLLRLSVASLPDVELGNS